jgi:hypothetical protein
VFGRVSDTKATRPGIVLRKGIRRLAYPVGCLAVGLAPRWDLDRSRVSRVDDEVTGCIAPGDGRIIIIAEPSGRQPDSHAAEESDYGEPDTNPLIRSAPVRVATAGVGLDGNGARLALIHRACSGPPSTEPISISNSSNPPCPHHMAIQTEHHPAQPVQRGSSADRRVVRLSIHEAQPVAGSAVTMPSWSARIQRSPPGEL